MVAVLLVAISGQAGADKYQIGYTGPSTKAAAFATGIETGKLILQLQTNPDISGEYSIQIRLDNGGSVTHVIRTRHQSARGQHLQASKTEQ